MDIAQRIKSKHRVPYKKLAEEYSVDVRQIKRDVQWIRKQIDLPSIQKIVADKVVHALENCDEEKDRKFIISQGLPFLAKGIPQRVEMESKEEIYSKHEETLNVRNYSEEDKIAILDAYRRITSKENSSPDKSSSLH